VRSRPVAAWGFPFQAESNDDALVRLIDWCYGDLPDATGPASCFEVMQRADQRYSVAWRDVDGSVVPCGDGRALDSVMELLTWEVNRRVMRSAGAGVVVHGAAFAGPLGAVVLTAPSECGKSTLAAAAAQRGWVHLGDDVVLIDGARREVYPFARPIMLRPGGRELLGVMPALVAAHAPFMADEWYVPASALGAAVVHGAVPLVAVGVLVRGGGAGLAPLSAAAALHALAQQSPSLAHAPAAAFAELERLARTVPAVEATLGAPHAVLDLLAPMLGHAS